MLKGFKEFDTKLTKIKQQFQREAKKEIAKTLLEIHGDTVKKLNQGKRSGTIYKKGANRYHQASAVGEYPKTDTGQLASSLYFDMEGEGSKVTGNFGTKAAHGKHLEYKPAAQGGRPWLKPQFDKYAIKLKERLMELNKKLLLK
jgi:hypothetical protein